MSIKYALVENRLTTNAEDHTALPQEIKSNDLDHIITYMLKKGTTITKTDALAVLESFFEAVEDIIERGETIHTDFIKTSYSIQGVFNGSEDGFDASRHKIRLNLTPAKRLLDALAKVTVEKGIMSEAVPKIREVKDRINGNINGPLVSSGSLEILGSMLKIEGEDSANGIALVADDGTVTQITDILENKPSRLIVLLPVLSPGIYTLKISTQLCGSNLLNTPRTGTFSKSLRVA